VSGLVPGARRGREGWRDGVARRLGLVPTTKEVVARWLDEALPASGGAALDAGCGRQSQLRPFRSRIHRFVGVDIHAPSKPLGWLDEFEVVDVCSDRGAFPDGTFDVAFSSFTVEHFADPGGAFASMAGWLRPGGWLVISTVNRRHPLVDAYLSLPSGIRDRLQPVVKSTAADAHPLVGACNSPAELREALRDAGFEQVELVTTAHLWRAWGKTLPTWALGLAGDWVAQRWPLRRSTIVARARRPLAAAA
jgi:SAM-dependent methyltransferase